VAEPLRSTDVGPAALLPAPAPASTARTPARAADATTVALVATAGAIAWLVLFYPGLMSADSAGQLAEARRGVFSDAHPPLVAALWRLLERVVPGPFGMLVLQTTVFWTGLALLARRLRAPTPAKVAFVLAVGFAPPLISIAGAIWKDVLMVALLLLAFALAGGGRAFWLCALLATMTRHNAIVAVAGAVLLRFWTSGPSPSGLVRAGAATLALFVAALGINAALTHTRSNPTQMVALFDVVGIAAAAGTTPALPDCYLRKPPLAHGDVARSYDPRSIVYLISPDAAFRYCYQRDASSELLRAWRDAIAGDPGAYLTHRLAVFAHLLGVHDTPGNWIMTRSTYTPAQHPGVEAAAPQSARLQWLERVVVPLRPLGVFRPWIYALVAIAACAVAAGRHLWWPFCIALSGIAYEAGLLVVAPSEDYRYSLWMIVAGLVAAAWVAIETAAGRGAAARME